MSKRLRNPLIQRFAQKSIDMQGDPKLTGVPLTMQGVVGQVWLAAAFLVAGAVIGWFIPAVGVIAAFIALAYGIYLAFKVGITGLAKAGSVLGYALLEGMALGGISKFTETMLPGIVVPAIIATLIAFFVILSAFSFGLRSNPKLSRIVLIAAIAYIAFAVINLLTTSLLGVNLAAHTIYGIPLGLIIGLITLAMGLYFLLEDFTNISDAIDAEVDDAFGWGLTFSLILSIVWVYMDILDILTYYRRTWG